MGQKEDGQRRENGQGARGGQQKEKDQFRISGNEGVGFLWHIILSVFDLELAPCLRSWIQATGLFLPLSFFCHSNDDTWHTELASAHGFVLFFFLLCSIWVFGVTDGGLKATLQLSPLCPLLLDYLEIPPAWHGFL